MEVKYKYKMKEGITINIITKTEAEYLREKGRGEYVHNGHGTYKRYYVTQNPKVLKELEDYRESITKK